VAWVRIDENAMEHPKVAGLPDGAFRLWVQGLAHCQKFLTDGAIDRISLRGLRAYSPKRTAELVAARLWLVAEHDGIAVHDYLQWNESREHVQKVRAQGRERIRRLRGRNVVGNGVTARELSANDLRSYSGGVVCSPSQQFSSEEERGSGKTETPEQRAGNFCEWYAGTHLRLFGVGYIGNPRSDYDKALMMVKLFSDAQLRDAALVWFGMDDDFATAGTRTIPKFASRASKCVEMARLVAS
jgi:hypothetical protein